MGNQVVPAQRGIAVQRETVTFPSTDVAILTQGKQLLHVHNYYEMLRIEGADIVIFSTQVIHWHWCSCTHYCCIDSTLLRTLLCLCPVSS